MDCTSFVCWPAADELRGRAAFGVMRLLRVLRRCAFAGSPPALERRRIAAPRFRTSTPRSGYHGWRRRGMVRTWLSQRLTTLVASGAALHPACDMLWLRILHRECRSAATAALSQFPARMLRG